MTQLDLRQEYIPPGEAEAIATVLQINERILDQTEKPVVKRGEHSKGHGCIRGRLVVDAEVADNPKLQVGLFQHPGEAFSVCIRYSNFSVKDDARGDLRGMAIKVFNAPGEKVLEDEKNEHTQDFLLVDYPVFVVRNAKDYIDLFLEIERTKSRSPVGFFIPGLNPFRWRWHELLIGLAYRLKTIPSLFETQYWSMTPYRLGDEAVKLTLIPSPSNRQGGFWRRLGPRSNNYLREGMRDHLGDRGAAFDLLVQFQTDADSMPIEDPTIRWTSPFHRVATLTIPTQTFESPEQMAFCENLSFTPWHSLVAHRPLGGINRTRKVVYEQIARMRNLLNSVEHREPSLAEFDSVYPVNSGETRPN